MRSAGVGTDSPTPSSSTTGPAATSVANSTVARSRSRICGEASKPGVGPKARSATALPDPSPEVPDVVASNATTKPPPGRPATSAKNWLLEVSVLTRTSPSTRAPAAS